jgi:hypothetical protein
MEHLSKLGREDALGHLKEAVAAEVRCEKANKNNASQAFADWH